MKIANAFRRQSSSVENERDLARQVSAGELERRSSLVTLPVRLRRRRTKTGSERCEEDEQAAQRLGQLFFSMPSEILTTILSYMSLQDIYSLRLTSQATLSILCTNAGTVSRQVLSKSIPQSIHEYVQTYLYTITSPCHSLAPLFRTLHRRHVIDRTINNTLSYIRMKVYQLPPNSFGLREPAAIGTEISLLLEKPMWTLYHFLESTRTLLFHGHDETHESSVGKFWSCTLCSDATTSLVNSYPSEIIIPTFHVYKLLIAHLRAATRAPSSTGTIERRIRGWGKGLTDDDTTYLVLLGGLEILSKISLMQGSYNKRIELITNFLNKITRNVNINSDITNKERTSSPKNQQQDQNISPKPAQANEHNLTRTISHTTINSNSNSNLKPNNLTESLSPNLTLLTQDHLSRIPQLEDFFTTIWKERIERENLLDDKNGDELEIDSILWIQRKVYGPQRNGNGNGNGQGVGGNQFHGQLVVYNGLNGGVIPICSAPPVEF